MLLQPRRFLTVSFLHIIDYVLQRALSVVEGEQRETLLSKVRPQLMNMRRYSSAYSKHLIASKCSPTLLGDNRSHILA